MEDADFWLVRVTASTDGWIAEGRAYNTIRLDDTLTAHRAKTAPDMRPRLIVRAISTYGRGLPELDRGLTGTLLLQGSGGEVLEDDSYLYKTGAHDELRTAE